MEERKIELIFDSDETLLDVLSEVTELLKDYGNLKIINGPIAVELEEVDCDGIIRKAMMPSKITESSMVQIKREIEYTKYLMECTFSVSEDIRVEKSRFIDIIRSIVNGNADNTSVKLPNNTKLSDEKCFKFEGELEPYTLSDLWYEACRQDIEICREFAFEEAVLVDTFIPMITMAAEKYANEELQLDGSIHTKFTLAEKFKEFTKEPYDISYHKENSPSTLGADGKMTMAMLITSIEYLRLLDNLKLLEGIKSKF